MHVLLAKIVLEIGKVWHGRAEVDARGSRDWPQWVVRHEVCVTAQSSEGERHPHKESYKRRR